MSNTKDIFTRKGAWTTYHREGHTTLCPCVTPEGFRDPIWHKAHPEAPECNARGYLPDPIEYQVKAFVQPVYGARRLSQVSQNLLQAFGEFETDDHIGLFPTSWAGLPLDFENWSDAGDEWVEFNGLRFIVISWIQIPDPHDSSNVHHWEVSLRRINKNQPGDAGFGL